MEGLVEGGEEEWSVEDGEGEQSGGGDRDEEAWSEAGCQA